MTTVLITGGTGYIGSHTVLAPLNHHFKVIILDNLINSSFKIVQSIQSIAAQRIVFYHGDIRNDDLLAQIFSNH